MKTKLHALANSRGGDGEHLSAAHIHFGALAKRAFKNGKNPPGWAVDESQWDKAKEAASKSYDMDDDAFWPVVVSIYENMGGTIKGKAMGNATDDALPEYSTEFIGMGNDGAIDDNGWALIPFGSWPHPDGLQQFTRGAADKMVGYFKTVWNRIKRAVVGLSIYKGHPDLAAVANEYPDKREYGQVADLDVRPDGLAVRLVLSEAGASLVEKGWKYISPHWLANEIGKLASGQPIYEPVFLKSIGLTAHPNIPGHSLLNSAAAAAAGSQHQQENQKMLEALLKLLGLANDATEDAAKAAITALKTRPEPQALANEVAAKTAAEGKATALEGEKATLTTKLTDAQTALANERKARISEHLDAAIRDGRIVEADRKTWQARLEAKFAEESVALANAQKVIKTDAQTKDLANRSKDDEDAALEPKEKGAKIKQLVNAEKTKLAHMKNEHERHNAAFANVKRAHPKLFDSVYPGAQE